ncbi:MAG: STAS domain-containing protein [Actinomycetota bacterium]
MSDTPPVGARQLTIATRLGTDGAVLLRIIGEVDLATVPKLSTALRATIAGPTSPTEVRIDLAATSFIDAAGVGALVEGREAARRAGVGFAVDNATGVVRRLLDILGLTDALHVEVVPRSATAPPMPRPGPPPL